MSQAKEDRNEIKTMLRDHIKSEDEKVGKIYEALNGLRDEIIGQKWEGKVFLKAGGIAFVLVAALGGLWKFITTYMHLPVK
ncbi:hypothetical protein N9937_02250 [bacterium]|nr:hypothetical protein [bacterium]